MGSDDQSHNFVKGKRTKRQRSSSPFGLRTTTHSLSSDSADGHPVRGGGDTGVIIDDYNSISSPTMSGEIIYESTEEEEDMANCLIMLAQGKEGPKKIQENNNIIGEKIEKLSNSRKFFGIVSTGTNKAGFYVYECRTCNRSFPSFQALGGHRASHKKPKAAAIEEKKSSSVAVLPLKEDYYSEEAGQQFNKTSPPPPPTHLSVQTVANKGYKIHECSICGSEFTSGQALGGHMRRHRAVAAATTGNQAAAAAINISSTIGDEVKPAATRSILPLDLNLPAPEDHDYHYHLRDSKFQFGSTQQALVFSAAALVDCHY